MPAALTAQRCLHHPVREAVARCVECRQYFCRECITDHQDRIVCSACLKVFMTKKETSRWKLRKMMAPLPIVMGVIIAWLFFYFAGRVFILIPTRYHEGTVWLGEDALEEE